MKATEQSEKLPIGLFYKAERPVLEEHLAATRGAPLVKQPLDPMKFEKLLDEYT
jgi:hypothetical protein